MAISPQVISWSYQKGSGIVPNTIVKLTTSFSADRAEIRTLDKPNWLNVFLDTLEYRTDNPKLIDFFNVKVSVVPTYANNLSIGNHQARFRIGYPLPFLGTVHYQYLTVNISVTQVQKLEVRPSLFLFAYTNGDPLPASKFMNVITSRNFQLTPDVPWISVSPQNGSGNTAVKIDVDPTLATESIQIGQILVDDGNSTFVARVQLKKFGTQNPEDSQEVSPKIIEFSGEVGAVSAVEKQLSVTNTQEITVTSNVPWINVSQTIIAPGNTELGVSIQNANELPEGVHNGKITLTSDYGVDEVFVVLRIVVKSAAGIESNGFYFAQDRNELFLTSSEENTEALFDFEVESSRGFSLFSKRVPFFQNSASSIIGLETANLLSANAIPTELTTQVYAGIKPMLLKLSVSDKNLQTFSVTSRSVYSGLKFLNGKTPVIPDRLSYIPNTITVPADGILALNFRETENTPLADLNISGSVTGILPIDGIDRGIYTILINLADYGMKPGDAIEITAPAFAVKVRIADSVVNAVPLIWLNEWDLPEVFNLTGEIEITYDDDSRRTVKSVAGRELTTIIDVKDAKSFAVNTGNVYSEAEAQWLGTILRSKKMWLQLGTDRVEVVPTFRRLSVSQSRRHNRSYDLTFEAAAR